MVQIYILNGHIAHRLNLVKKKTGDIANISAMNGGTMCTQLYYRLASFASTVSMEAQSSACLSYAIVAFACVMIAASCQALSL